MPNDSPNWEVLPIEMSEIFVNFLILFAISCFSLQADCLFVARGKLDVFNNPNRTKCQHNVRYCRDRRARCFGSDCCMCKCEKEFSTFHSPGVSYEFKDGIPRYRFDKKESCVWNHYAHEGITKILSIQIIKDK